MYIAVPTLLHLVGVNSELYRGIWTELWLVLLSLSQDSLISIISNAKLCSDIRFVSSPMWKKREDIFKC